ncbi:MAG: carboxymuconolactone decarboxylase family protein, partial [Actinobacteria bacterium]|nr:carboxymuconolactone decarboxylase family protein [Actinomycetota bacterium]
PLVLGAYGRFQQAITEHGTFDVRTREAIALAVAAVDNCADCQFPHTIGCRAAGWTLEQISALRSGERIRYEDKLTALLAVARQVVERTGDVDEDTWCHALQAGWTIDELAELFTHIFANIFTNYLNHYTRADGDSLAASGFREASA